MSDVYHLTSQPDRCKYLARPVSMLKFKSEGAEPIKIRFPSKSFLEVIVLILRNEVPDFFISPAEKA